MPELLIGFHDKVAALWERRRWQCRARKGTVIDDDHEHVHVHEHVNEHDHVHDHVLTPEA